MCMFAVRKAAPCLIHHERDLLPDAKKQQSQDSPRKVWRIPKLETLPVSMTKNGFFAVNFETQFLFRVS